MRRTGTYFNGGISYSKRVASKRITEMTEHEYRVFKARRSALYHRKKMLMIYSLIFMTIVLIALAFKGISSSAASYDKNEKCKYYKTEMIKFDKDINKIAEEYYDPEFYSSVEDVRKEIMEVNHLSYGSAIPGGLIVYVPYYGDVH